MSKHCGNCANKLDPFYVECRKCVISVLENGEQNTPSRWKEKPPTNFNRIISMSSEELAEFWVSSPMLCDWCTKKGICDLEYVQTEQCKNGILEWLNKPEK